MICAGCEVSRPEAFFRVNRHGNRGGLCRSCRNEQGRAWRKAHPETIAEYQQRWRRAHPTVLEAKRQRYRAKYPERTSHNRTERQNRMRAREAGALVVAQVDRLAIFERDEWICQLCHGVIDRTLTHPDRLSASLDHVIGLKQGGTHEADNLQAAHLTCNQSKAGRMRRRK